MQAAAGREAVGRGVEADEVGADRAAGDGVGDFEAGAVAGEAADGDVAGFGDGEGDGGGIAGDAGGGCGVSEAVEAGVGAVGCIDEAAVGAEGTAS